MRARRSIVVGFVAGVLLALPNGAAADGGAYIDFGETHHLVGETAEGLGYVSIPEKHQDLLERGPFTVYVLPPGAWIEAGKPIPHGAIPVGTATIHQEDGTVFEVETTFTVPDVPGDYYTVQLCNSPCTIAGFSEPLSATISIVQTEREATLLNQYRDLYSKNWSLRRQAKKAERANEELEASLTSNRGAVSALSTEVARLEAELEAASAPPPVALDAAAPADQDRPLVDAWALVAIGGASIVALLAIALAMVFSGRHSRRFVVPDTIEELDATVEELARG